MSRCQDLFFSFVSSPVIALVSLKIDLINNPFHIFDNNYSITFETHFSQSAPMALKAIVATSLLGSENPFQWQIRNDLETVPEDMIGRLHEKLLSKISNDDNTFSNVALSIALAYEYFVAEKPNDALRVLYEIQEQTKSEDDITTEKWLLAILHVIYSCQVYILMLNDDLDAAFVKSQKIPSVSKMNEPNIAALLGLRAAYYAEYGLYGTKLAVNYAVQAHEKDPENFFWYFLKGKLLGRVRRVETPFDIPSKVELEALETALQKEWHPACVIFMAELYRETAYRVFKKHRDERTLFPQLKSKIDEMNAQSRNLYRKSVQLKPDCPRIMFRAAKGFIKLPEPYRDNKLAKELLERGLKINPNSAYGNHVMAQFYERREKKAHLAIKHLRICVDLKVYGACIDLLRLEFHQRQINSDELLSRLHKMYEEYPENPRRCQTLSQLASYYIFVELNLTKASEYIVQIFRMNPRSEDVFKHRPIYLRVLDTISLLDLIIDEIKIRMQDINHYLERDIYEKLFVHLRELNIPVSDHKPEYLKDQLLNGSKIIRQDRKSFRRPDNRLILQNICPQKLDAHSRLQKVQNFIDSWETEVVAQRSNRNVGGIDFENPVSKYTVNDESDSDSQLLRIIYHDSTTRDKKDSKFNVKRKESIKSSGDVAMHSTHHTQDISSDFKNVRIEEAKNDRKCNNRKNNSFGSPSDDSDSDFENSVRAYRETKQSRNLKVDLSTNEKKNNLPEFFKKQFTQSESNARQDYNNSSRLSAKSSTGIKKNKNEPPFEDEFNYNSVVEKLIKKFEPKIIKF